MPDPGEDIRELVRQNAARTNVTSIAFCDLALPPPNDQCLNGNSSPIDPPMAYSNVPEAYETTYTTNAKEGIVSWHPNVPMGRLRVVLYHRNKTGLDRELFVTFHNVGGKKKKVRCVFAGGYMGTAYPREGKRAVRQWLLWDQSSDHPGGEPEARFGWQTIDPAKCYVHQDMFWRYNVGGRVFTNTQPSGALVASGIFEYDIEIDMSDTTQDVGTMNVLVEARAARRAPNTPPPATPTPQDIFQEHNNLGDTNRGRAFFQKSGKLITDTFVIPSGTTDPKAVFMGDNLSRIELPANYCDASLWGLDNVHQTIVPTQTTDHGFLQGNFAVHYNVSLELKNEANYPIKYALVSNPTRKRAFLPGAPMQWGTYVRGSGPPQFSDFSVNWPPPAISALPSTEPLFTNTLPNNPSVDGLCPYATIIFKDQEIPASGTAKLEFTTFGAPTGVVTPCAWWVVPYT